MNSSVPKLVRPGMKYQVFYEAIRREFGAKWDHIASNRFEDLAIFIQGRIARTILGKKQAARGIKNYSTFSEYLTKHVG